mmetsp:Transcript_30915/g.60870  ORF Transcript_30915/g.60870 Transcript_30915/m.60870 type:complete len:114 (-) Transcript_30915:1240-1581(-)
MSLICLFCVFFLRSFLSGTKVAWFQLFSPVRGEGRPGECVNIHNLRRMTVKERGARKKGRNEQTNRLYAVDEKTAPLTFLLVFRHFRGFCMYHSCFFVCLESASPLLSWSDIL